MITNYYITLTLCYVDTNKSEEGSEDVEMVSMRMREELQWLQAPPPSYQQVSAIRK